MGVTGSRSIGSSFAGGSGLFRGNDGGVVLQLFEAAGSHNGSRMDAFNGRHAGIRNAGFDGLHVRHAFIDDEYKSRLPVVLDGVRGNQRNAIQRLHQQLRVDELIREQGIVCGCQTSRGA